MGKHGALHKVADPPLFTAGNSCGVRWPTELCGRMKFTDQVWMPWCAGEWEIPEGKLLRRYTVGFSPNR